MMIKKNSNPSNRPICLSSKRKCNNYL